MRRQMRLSGSGAAVSEGKQAVQSQSYGPEARGGASKSEVIIDDGTIFHPHVKHPDYVLAMTQKAADKYFEDMNPDGVLVLDSDLVPSVPDVKNVVQIPITKLAVEKVGKALFANIVALGALVKLTKIVELDTIKRSVANRVPPATVEKNMYALQIGYDAVA